MTAREGSEGRVGVSVLYVAADTGRSFDPDALLATEGIAAVRTATDPAGAMSAREEVDCVLVESAADGGDLPGLVETMRVGRPDLAVVVVATDADVAQGALAAGANDFVPRDADLREVAVRVRAASQSRGQSRTRPERDLTTRLVELVPVGILLIDVDGTVLFANEYAEDWMELRRDPTGRGPYESPSWREIRPGGDPIPDEELVYRQVVDTGETVTDADCVLEWPDGARRHYTAHGAPMVDADGDVELVVFAFRDTTDRVRRQRDLEFVRQLVEKVGVGVVAYGRDGHIEFANPAFAELHGGAVEDVEGAFVWEMEPELDAETFDDYWASFDQGETRRTETLHRRCDGSTVPVEATTTRVHLADEVVNVGTVKDISERRERDERLAVLNRVLRHNLRNELNVILGKTETLRALQGASDHFDAIEESARSLYGISEKAQRMERTLRDGMDEPGAVRVATLVEREAESLAEAVPDVEVTVDVPDEVQVLGDETLRTALDELLTNAVEHNDLPMADRTVTVRARTDGEEVTIDVLDNGPGIPEEERNVLTNDRERTPVYHGSGLGLWVVNWVVRRFDGEFTVTGREGRGSCVRIELPVAE